MAKSDVLIVGGFGHVGLPLGITLADAGLTVRLQDINNTWRPMIEAGTMPFLEYDAEPLLKKVIGKTLFVSDGLEDAAEAKIIVIVIGTPIDEYMSPRMEPLFALAEKLLPHLKPDHCVLLRSTVFPGTTRALHEFFKTKGKPVHVANCPERIAQGYAIRELKELPQIVSGCTPEAATIAKELFGKLGVETLEVTADEAEFAKLFLNSWRYIQFAAGNEFYMLAKERGLDYDAIYKAMTYKYARAKALPGPGFAAGPCLLKDTMQLAAAGGDHFPLGHAAMLANEGLPAFVVRKLMEDGIAVRGKKVGILGMAFKADIDDTRDALSYKLRKILRFEGAEVLCSDEFVNDPSFISKEELLAQSDIVIVGVPHSAYKKLAAPTQPFVDLWGIFSRS